MQTGRVDESSQVSQMAHDLANFIQGICLVLKETDWESAPRAELLQRVAVLDQCSRHASDVCHQMINPNEENSDGGPKLDVVDLVHMTEEFAEILNLFVGSRGKLEVASDGKELAVLGNATELRQVLLDLVTNSRDALSTDDGLICVRTGHTDGYDMDSMVFSSAIPTDGGTGYVYLEIRDNGHGIPADKIEKFFRQRFTTKLTGHGIGISSVQRIVHRCGGTIGVRSQDGQGTTIRCVFPRVKLPVANHQVVPKESVSISVREKPVTILLVEDSDAICRMTSLQLEKWKDLCCEIITAHCVQDGVEKIRNGQHAVDVIITDMMLPDGLGSDILRQVRQISANLPVIVMSGLPSDELTKCFTEHQPSGFLFKPLETEAIVSLIKEVVAS